MVSLIKLAQDNFALEFQYHNTAQSSCDQYFKCGIFNIEMWFFFPENSVHSAHGD